MSKWPTLKGRLSQPLTTTVEALQQMKRNGDILTPLAEDLLMRGVTGNTPDFESGDEIVHVGSTPTASANFES